MRQNVADAFVDIKKLNLYPWAISLDKEKLLNTILIMIFQKIRT